MSRIRTAGIVVFCALLAGGFLSYFFVPQREFSDTENRSLETKPEFSVSDVLAGEYQEHYETYLSDQMFGRDQWVNLAAAMERFTGRRDINGVYIGKDGYLLEKYTEADFDAVQVEENIACLSDFLNTMADRYGKEHVACMMLPSKANAMPEKLPGYADVNEEADTIAALKSRLEDEDVLLDATETLRAHQDAYIYFRTDHHWTALGAYYAYCAWAELTGHEAAPAQDYDRETVFWDFYGTTYNKAHIPVPADYVELFHGGGEEGVKVIFDDGKRESGSFYFIKEALEGFNRYNVFLSQNTAKIEIKTKAKTERSLLLIKDSFANCFVPFLSGDYEKIIMIDPRYSRNSIYDVLEQNDEITDILVMYNVEKFMQDTNLHALDQKSDTMEEFQADDFFEDLEDE